MPSIVLPESLSNYVNGAVKLTSSFTTLAEAVSYLHTMYPELYSTLFSDAGEVNEAVNFYLNSTPVTDSLREAVPLAEHDCLEIVTLKHGQ